MKAIMLACVVSAVGVLTAPQPSEAGDAQRGEVLFGECAKCHSPEPGIHKSGPSLAGVVGRPVAGAEGYKRYSSALQTRGEAGAVWTPEDLQAFLADPFGVVPGTGMRFMLKDEADRADVIAYLQTLIYTAPKTAEESSGCSNGVVAPRGQRSGHSAGSGVDGPGRVIGTSIPHWR